MVRTSALITAVLLTGCQQKAPSFTERYAFLQRMMASKEEKCALIDAAKRDAANRLDGQDYSFWQGRHLWTCEKGGFPVAGEKS